MHPYLEAATRTNTNTVVGVNIYHLDGGWSAGIMGKQYANKGMAIMQATNAARREGKTVRIFL